MLTLTHKHTRIVLHLCVHAYVQSHTILQVENASFEDRSKQYEFPQGTPASTKDDHQEGG